MHNFSPAHRPRRTRPTALVLTCLGLMASLAGCGRDDIHEIIGQVREWPGRPALGGTAIPFEQFQDQVGDLAASERRVLIKTREAYQSLFGHAPPASVRLPDEWVIFYAAGTKPSGGFSASIQHLVRVEAGSTATLRSVTRLQSPGKGCVVTDALTQPHVLVKFKAQPGALSIDFLRNDVVADCGTTTNPCAAILCPVDHECLVLETFPPQAKCVPIPSKDPCATVRCARGTHCEARPVVCVRAPCPPIAECVADGPFCGGIAGIACPGSGQCVDDPRDDCNPNRGGADCGGICTCGDTVKAAASCLAGQDFDASAGVCACVPAKPQACGSKTCPAGQVCCNASCGICTPPGGACIQIACGN